jgi:hypothetical protein
MEKTELEMLKFAQSIVVKSPNAYVGFFLPSYDRVRALVAEYEDDRLDKSLTFDSRRFRFSNENGSHLTLMTCTEDTLHYLAGLQLTHVFYNDVSWQCVQGLESRIRSARYNGRTQMGVYNKWYAHVKIEY